MNEIADSYVSATADRRRSATPSGTASISRPGAGEIARRWSPGYGVRWTWKELTERVDALAAGLLALGPEPGARIGVWSLNRPEWTLTQFAAAKAGLILVTINPAYRTAELEYALNSPAAPRRHGHRFKTRTILRC